MGKRQNLKRQLKNRIYNAYQYGKGVKRHDLKKQGKSSIAITSNRSYMQYTRDITHFADWCKQEGIKNMYMAEKNAPRYLDYLSKHGGRDGKGVKPTTLKTYKSALSKCFGKEIDYKVAPCYRADVTNNRGKKESHKHINTENYQEALGLISHCGARHSELVKVTEKDKNHGILEISQNDNNKIYVRIRGKGGKIRRAEWVGSVAEANQFYKDLKNTNVGEQIYRAPKDLPTHRARQVYAKAVYNRYKKPLNTLSKKNKYYCRAELKGLVFDRNALYKVQHNIGHNDLHCVTRYLFN